MLNYESRSQTANIKTRSYHYNQKKKIFIEYMYEYVRLYHHHATIK